MTDALLLFAGMFVLTALFALLDWLGRRRDRGPRTAAHSRRQSSVR